MANMTRLEEQIKELSPSVKDALYRRLLFDDNLAWLRDDKKKDRVIGFEVDLEGQELSGFALIAIQRHTVIAFVSERNEQPRLILFPALETLFDPGFELLNLIVTRKEFKDSTFVGEPNGHGRFGDMVKDLTPPNRRMDISDTVVAQMADSIHREEEAENNEPDKAVVSPAPSVPKPQPVQVQQQVSEPEYEDTEEPEYEEGPPEEFDEPDDFDNFEEPGEYDDYEDDYYGDDYDSEPEPEKELSRSDKLKAQNFNSLSEITDYVVMNMGVNRPLAVTLVNKAMQSKVSPEYRIQLAVNIFCKLMDENKI